MDENDKIHLRKAATALNRVLRNEAGLQEHVKREIEKRKERLQKAGRVSSIRKAVADDISD